MYKIGSTKHHTHIDLLNRHLLPPANEVCEGYVFTGVCLSTGGHAWLLRGVCMVAPGWGGMHGCSRGWHAWLLWGDLHCSGGVCGCSRGGHAWLLWGGMHGCSGGACMVALGGHAWLLGGHAWDTTRYGDTIHERVLRILLECILVIVFFPQNHSLSPDVG